MQQRATPVPLAWWLLCCGGGGDATDSLDADLANLRAQKAVAERRALELHRIAEHFDAQLARLNQERMRLRNSALPPSKAAELQRLMARRSKFTKMAQSMHAVADTLELEIQARLNAFIVPNVARALRQTPSARTAHEAVRAALESVVDAQFRHEDESRDADAAVELGTDNELLEQLDALVRDNELLRHLPSPPEHVPVDAEPLVHAMSVEACRTRGGRAMAAEQVKFS